MGDGMTVGELIELLGEYGPHVRVSVVAVRAKDDTEDEAFDLQVDYTTEGDGDPRVQITVNVQ